MQVDAGLQALAADLHSKRPYPAKDLEEPNLTPSEKRKSQGFMRVNDTGEVCAQALYQSQKLVAHHEDTDALLQKAAEEEIEHLAWTGQRLQELNTHRSYLNIIWYLNAYMVGLIAGLAGDRWSLGFVEETERQVEQHLQGHLGELPKNDIKSRKVVDQMREDEIRHGQSAKDAGAAPLPLPIKKLMSAHAKIMTTLAYWI